MYLLFGNYIYYPSGADQDFIGKYDNLNSIIEYVKNKEYKLDEYFIYSINENKFYKLYPEDLNIKDVDNDD